MFRFEGFCDDKHVAKVLLALVGICIGQPTMQPVINAEVRKKGKGAAIAAKSDGSMPAMLMADLRKANAEDVTPRQIQTWLKKRGFSANSYSYALRSLMAWGELQKVGKGMGSRYVIVTVRQLAAPKKGN